MGVYGRRVERLMEAFYSSLMISYTCKLKLCLMVLRGVFSKNG